MSRLPIPGSDDGTWGSILNDFLTQAHNSDGSLKSVNPTDVTGTAVVTSDSRLSDARAPADGSVTDAKITAGGLSPSKITGTAVVASALPSWLNNGNGTIFTADGHNLSIPYRMPSTSGASSPETHWADYDHAETAAAGRIQFIQVPWTSSGWAARVEARTGEAGSGDDSSVDRVEMSATGLGAASAQGYGDGTDMWWSFSIMLDPQFSLPTKSGSAIWHLVHQFYAQNFANGVPGTGGGSPPFDIEVSSAGQWLVSFRSGAKASSGASSPNNYAWTVGTNPAEKGIPHDFLIRYRYSSGTDGKLQVYYRKRGNQFPSIPQVNLFAGQNIISPSDGSKAGGIGAGPGTATGVTATTVGSEVISYYPETGIYRQRPDTSPAATVVYHGGLVGRTNREEAEKFWSGINNQPQNIQNGLIWTYGQPFVPSNGTQAPGQFRIEGVRISIPKSGTITAMSFWVGVQSGNVIGQIFDTGDASSGNLTALWTSSSVAVSVSGWQTAWTPNIRVEAGQQLYAGIMFDNATAAYGYAGSLGSVNLLPSGFLPATGGANPRLAFDFGNGSFTPPASIADSTGQSQGHPPFIICQII